MRRRPPQDPHWITVRYAETFTCAGKDCGKPIARGSRAFYYPNGRRLFGEACGCGAQQQASFDAAAFDEENNRSL